MLGYRDLKEPSVSAFSRFLAKVGDGIMKMQIVRIEFGGKKASFRVPKHTGDALEKWKGERL